MALEMKIKVSFPVVGHQEEATSIEEVDEAC